MKSILTEFRALPDYRKVKQIKFNVGEILFLSLLAMLSGANGYQDMEFWIKMQRKELTKLLGYKFRPPADNTIRNVFLNIDLEALNKLFENWSQLQKSGTNKLTIVSADGKTMRGSADKVKNKKAKHIVSLFLSQEKLTIAQTEVGSKTNEIPALLELLEALKMEKCIITVDAMHNQKKTLQKIVDKGHDFVSQVKRNQKKLVENIEYNISIDNKPVSEFKTVDNGHGREEERICKVYDDLYMIDEQWGMAKRFIVLTSKVEENGSVTESSRYYLSSLTEDAENFLYIIRSHWSIENSLHYVKDVAFQEDFNRMRKDQIPSVASLLRSLAINILNLNYLQNKTQARKMLAWSANFLLNLEHIRT